MTRRARGSAGRVAPARARTAAAAVLALAGPPLLLVGRGRDTPGMVRLLVGLAAAPAGLWLVMRATRLARHRRRQQRRQRPVPRLARAVVVLSALAFAAGASVAFTVRGALAGAATGTALLMLRGLPRRAAPVVDHEPFSGTGVVRPFPVAEPSSEHRPSAASSAR